MTNRFDNIPTADLLAREMEDRKVLRELQDAVRERLKADAGIEIGAIYRIVRGRFKGRRMLALYVVPQIPDVMKREPYETTVGGRLNGKSAAGDGWTIRTQRVRIENVVKE